MTRAIFKLFGKMPDEKHSLIKILSIGDKALTPKFKTFPGIKSGPILFLEFPIIFKTSTGSVGDRKNEFDIRLGKKLEKGRLRVQVD